MNERLRVWGANIKRARTLHGLSQEALAESVGVTQSSVQRWEKGLCAPRDELRLALAVALHQDVAMLFPLFRPVGV
jgi:transcriptional regulator with XRE-family HTH domain